MVVNDLINPIKSLGFSEYEAKAYLCLLKIQPATPYEIAQASGIPSSKIYEIISRMVEKQVFMPDGEGTKKKYMALLPKEFIERQRNHFNKTLSVLETKLPELQNEKAVSFIWNISDYHVLMDKAKTMIEEASGRILLSAWKTERDLLETCLIDAQKREVDIAAIHFGKGDTVAGTVFHHPIEDTIYREKGGRGLLLITDFNAALMGTIDMDLRVHGAVSANQGFITLAEDYIKHDIYIMKIVNRFDDLLIRKFGDNYAHLRNIFEDKDIP
ncbi:MAG: hypothetical protein KKD44_04605 [Proteobacteria bacterium]|nr:hypothetical protein [Pseudomonadota bacterium]